MPEEDQDLMRTMGFAGFDTTKVSISSNFRLYNTDMDHDGTWSVFIQTTIAVLIDILFLPQINP